MVEGGIAGIVDLRTRKPLDSKNFVAVSGDWNYADKRKEGFFSGNAVISHRWDTPGGTEIGLQLSASTGKTGNRTDAVQTGSISTTTLTSAQSGLPAGTTVALPSGLGYRSVEWTQVRHSYDAVLQVKPSSSLLFTFEGMIAKVTPRDTENAVQINDQYGGFNLDPSFTFTGPNHTLATGTLTNAQLVYDTRVGQQDKVTREFYGSMFWTPTDHLTVSVDVDHVNSHASVYSMTAFDGFGLNGNRPTVAFDLTGKTPSLKFTENGLSLSDPANYFWYAAMQHNENNRASSWAERADVTYTLDEGSFFKAFKVGIRNTAKDLVTQSTNYNWGLLSTAYWGGGTPVYLNQDPGNVGLPGQTSQLKFGSFMGGNVSVPGGWFLGWPARQGRGQCLQVSGDHPGRKWWLVAADGRCLQRQRRLEQRLWHQHPDGKDPGRLCHGPLWRRRRSAGAFRWQHRRSCDPHANHRCGCNLPAHAEFRLVQLADCQQLYRATWRRCLRCSRGGGNVRWRWEQDSGRCPQQLHGRPAHVQLALLPQRQDHPAFCGGQGDLSSQLHRSSSEPDLQLQLPDGRLHAGGNRAAHADGREPLSQADPCVEFRRELRILLRQGQRRDIRRILQGRDELHQPAGFHGHADAQRGDSGFQVNIPVNGGHGTIKGFEAGYTMFFDSLPGALSGLGFNGNYTFIQSTGGRNPSNPQLSPGSLLPGNLPMQGLSKHSFNAALLYEKYGVSARLAYNWRSEYLANANGANVNQPVWNEAYGQLDGSFIVDVNSHLKVGVQAQNLLKAKTYIDVGPASLHPRYAWEETDRHVAFLVRAKF
jgi:hypothetical protein